MLVVALLCLGAAPADDPLIEAVKDGDADRVRALIAAQVDVNGTDADGTTALHWAANRDDLETTGLLIDAGADVAAANRFGATPLALAC